MEMLRKGGRVRWYPRASAMFLRRPEASVAVASHARTNGAAARSRDRPQAWDALRNQHTDMALPLALEADAVRREPRLDSL